ncbi:anhydro-N-acetylmuramic acid kinase [Pseudoxanthomonas dokdonensis]|uniref:Anhydro-N-acetylmuramic acid kinase n=1 Tax=Pseudoxanthomonas dokdonensis TaxID=344882 RepID=A0A0R0CPU7_9GAMM|nr:anhydro-N-acetylmuramic acid kinase [Pseudoxanthomonas dokdonensis]KRG71903.1 anhydro-N-acetylmuramic acid kinase [Pseudoxanthomonas dokdonensis]
MSVSTTDSALYVGLMSGTSADGIDAALVRFAANGTALQCELVLGRTFEWEDVIRAQLITLGQGSDAVTLDQIGRLDAQVGLAFAQATQRLLSDANVSRSAVAALGSHGQTIRHRPLADPPFTWQIGDGNLIAERTGITTVADFRRRDVAAGGHGAPLMPAFHAALLHSPDEDRAVLNLGGIGNFTLLPAHGPVRGFDTGPANALMDGWCERHTGKPFDAAGTFAAQGQADATLLQRLLDDAWFALPPPKSTGREQFHLAWLGEALQGLDLGPADVQATLLQLTVRTIADALRQQQPHTRRVLVCGGGVHNRALMAALAAALPDSAVESTAGHGLDPDYVEAMGFAWLARETLAGRPGNLPSVSGARGERVLGVIHPA